MFLTRRNGMNRERCACEELDPGNTTLSLSSTYSAHGGSSGRARRRRLMTFDLLAVSSDACRCGCAGERA